MAIQHRGAEHTEILKRKPVSGFGLRPGGKLREIMLLMRRRVRLATGKMWNRFLTGGKKNKS
ncbi:MAG: hypothetical protein JWM16_1754 [Verrucomicrobiales bacterium]|nr:hypothetical protein [Verrucomicrobiales bacterium]